MKFLRTMLCTLLISSTLCVAMAPATAQETEEQSENTADQMWYGTMSIPNLRQFRFLVKLNEQEGQWSGKLVSFDEGAREFAIENVVNTDARFAFKMRLTGATYEGTPGDEGQSVTGKWKQGAGELDLVFKRVDAAPEREVEAIWKGQLDIVIQKLDFAFVKLKSGEFVFDSISQKVGGFFTKDESTDEEVIFKVAAVRGTFTGKYSEDKSKIEGKWSQGGPQFDLVLEKAEVKDLAAKELVRTQTPKPPFPYSSKDVTFASKNADVTLAGTLTIPDGDVVAGVVMISGSGPQDRDESLLDHKPFLVIADHFSRHGIAVLRYDDRGFGKSSGNFDSATTFDFADDAEGAHSYLRSLPELQGVPVGLCGHSEGGLIGPVVGVRNEAVAFVVMMAGPGVNGEQILYKQLRLIMDAEKTAAEEVESAARFQRILLSTIVANIGDSKQELREKVIAAAKEKLAEENRQVEDLEKKVDAGLVRAASPWFRAFLTYEPKESLEKLTCPVLAINGEKDLQVDPDQNLPAIRAALEQAGNKQFEIIEYPSLNHLFQQCETGAMSEYQASEETFNEEPLRKMTEWIRAVVK